MPRLVKLRGISSKFETAVPGKLFSAGSKPLVSCRLHWAGTCTLRMEGKKSYVCSWRERSYPNGPRALRGSVERSFGREIERDPPRGRGLNRVCPKVNSIFGPMSALARSGRYRIGGNDAKGQEETMQCDISLSRKTASRRPCEK